DDAAAEAAGLAWGDRIVGVDGGSALTLVARVRGEQGLVRYDIERAGRRLTVELAPRPFSWPLLFGHFGVFFAVSALMLVVGVAVYAQNPSARPNRSFLLYMCLWAVSNVAVPASVLGSVRLAAAVAVPIKIVALLDTRRRAASPLVNQQTTVLLLGIGLGLGGWLAFMLAPLTHLYRGPLDPQWGSALVLLYPLAIAYATVRYRL